eukprot:365131-Chlamydomonas_euryale.AAC.5
MHTHLEGSSPPSHNAPSDPAAPLSDRRKGAASGGGSAPLYDGHHRTVSGGTSSNTDAEEFGRFVPQCVGANIGNGQSMPSFRIAWTHAFRR